MKSAHLLMRPILRVLSVATLVTGISVLAKTPVYEIIDLGTLGGDSATAYAINESGQVVGAADTGGKNPASHATLFSGTGRSNKDLGTLGGTASYATAISSDGRIVGMADNSDNSPSTCLYGKTTNENVDLGLLPGASGGHADEEVFASVNGVNADGIIVGSSPSAPSFVIHATIFTGNTNIDLGTLPGGANMISGAYAINDRGEIVGGANTITSINDTIFGVSHAAMFDGSGGVTDLGIVGGASYAAAISKSGEYIVGGDGYHHAALFGSNNIDLGTLGGASSYTTGVNDSGQIVGYSYTADGQITHGFLYTAVGGMADLAAMVDTSLGYTITRAVGINNLGQIAANATDKKGKNRAVLLIPRGAIPTDYTAIIPPSAETNLPQGYGKFTMVATSAGKATITGNLGDGTALSLTTNFTGGTITLHKNLYSGKGSLAGTITFESETNSDADGPLAWTKPATKRGLYPAGFTTSVDFQAAIFRAPALPAGTNSITFAAGGLASPITHSLTISAADHVTVNDPGADKMKMTVSKTGGTFSGTFLPPGKKTPTSFEGVVQQKQGGGAGYFLTSTGSGSVVLSPVQ